VETTIEVPCYLSKVTPLPAADAPESFDRWYRDNVTGPGARSAVAMPEGELVIEAGSLERYACPELAHPYRRVRGRLRSRNALVRDVAVEVELGPWSRVRSELAIRYAGRRGPGARRSRLFQTLGADVLEVLTATLLWHNSADDGLDERVIIAA
jgi:hypothetical protein